MVVSDVDIILIPENLPYEIYRRLVSMLNEDDIWKQVAGYFNIFSEDDIRSIMNNQQPAEKFLLELGIRLCTVDVFCEALEMCQLYDILTLFKKYSPARIIEQTSSTNSDNVQMVSFGQQITLFSKAVGIPPPKYQWYLRNVELSGKTESSLILQDFSLDLEGEYYCIIYQDGYGSISSNPVTLILAPEIPVIIKQPASKQMCSIGSTATLSILAKGHPQLNYQWYKENQLLDGCTNPILSVDIKNENENGKYRCYVYNSAGEVWSDESIIVTSDSHQTEPSTKLALLIGNQSYDNLNTLYTPENDVKTLADLLKDLGFLVIALQNLTLMEMRNAVHKFTELLIPSAYVVFYFAGHGFEIQDKFMLPVDTPGPDDYLQSNAMSERELLSLILSSNPRVFLELLDMCLKPPNPSNKNIFQETGDLYEYKASNNLIQGYSTTSYLGAYEKKTENNGLYVEHLKKYLTKNTDLPIVEILQRVARDVASVCPKQKPFFGTNITADYRLSDYSNTNLLIADKVNKLSLVPEQMVIEFKKINIQSKMTFSPYLDTFLNTLSIRFTNLENFRVTCETAGEELGFSLSRDNEVLEIKVTNIQRLVKSKTLFLTLMANEKVVDYAEWVIGRPMIAAADLWSGTSNSRLCMKQGVTQSNS